MRSRSCAFRYGRGSTRGRDKEIPVIAQNSATALEKATVEEFRAQLRGTLIQPGDDAYEEAHKVYNGMIDRHPGLIVRCVDVADVIASVNFAREHHLLL